MSQAATLGDLKGLERSFSEHQPLARANQPHFKKQGRAPQQFERKRKPEPRADHGNMRRHQQAAAPRQQENCDRVTLRGLDIGTADEKAIQQVMQIGVVIHGEHRDEITLHYSCGHTTERRNFTLRSDLLTAPTDQFGVLEVTWTRSGVYFQLMTIDELYRVEGTKLPYASSVCPVIRAGAMHPLKDLSEFTEQEIRPGHSLQHLVYKAVEVGVFHMIWPYFQGPLGEMIEVDYGFAERQLDIITHEAGRSGIDFVIDRGKGVTSVKIHADVVLAAGYEPRMSITTVGDYGSGHKQTPAQAGRDNPSRQYNQNVPA